MDPVSQRLLSADVLRSDKKSDEFLKAVIQGEYSSGKVVIAKIRDVVVLGLGTRAEFHAGIIARAGLEILNQKLVTTTNPDRAQPNPGVVIEGAFFKCSPEGKISISSRSMSFGGFDSRIFEKPTDEVVAEYILARIKSLKSLNSPANQPPSLADESFGSDLRQGL